MNLLLLGVLSLVVLGSEQPSNPPAIGGGVCVHTKQEQPEDPDGKGSDPQQDQGPGPDSESTSEKPNPVVLNQKEEKAEDTNQEPSTTDNVWDGWTPLTWITLILAIVTGSLACYTRKLANAALRQNRMLGFQNSLLKRQNELSKERHKLRRTIFYTENRPWIEVSNAFLSRVTENGEVVMIQELEEVLETNHQARITLRNTGNTPGTPTHCHFGLWILVPGDNRAYRPEWKKLNVGKILPGQSFQLPVTQGISLTGNEVLASGDPFVIGAVRYTDCLGKTRETGFGYWFNAASKQLEVAEDPSFTYKT